MQTALGARDGELEFAWRRFGENLVKAMAQCFAESGPDIDLIEKSPGNCGRSEAEDLFSCAIDIKVASSGIDASHGIGEVLDHAGQAFGRRSKGA